MRRFSITAVAVGTVVVLLTLGAISFVRWKAAGRPHEIAPPAGASAWLPEGEVTPAERDVGDRAAIIGRWLRNDRGDATVRIYAMPAGSPWLRARKLVATQLDHWEQIGDCADRPQARILECGWREPTRWWPREVQLTMLRRPAGSAQDFVIIGSGRGD
ncbi:hypothetical protein [Actinoplanes sp. NPDC023714]|uniref:hypothetical protein n=1 Tax=Actinoplanes sp. NPDC023714 TaxID=3154322 RepID=UPI0033C1082D